MAASKDFTKSTSKGSEEMFDICCSSCKEHGKTIEAKKFCVECGLYFCENCLGFHKIIPSLQSHHIVDSQGEQTQGKGEKLELPTQRCSTHHGKLMDMFCGDHDEVCCGACIAIKHRACINVDYVPNVAKGIRMSNEYKDVKGSITEVLNNMKQEKTIRTTNLTSLEDEKIKVLQEVDQYQEEIDLKIKELAESSRQDIRSKYEKIKKVITADVDTLDTLISTTDTNLQKLSITNEAQLFVNVKASKMAVKDGDSVLREMSSSWTNKHLKYARDENLKDKISSMVSFGNLEDEEDVKEYKATLYGKFNVKQNTDTQASLAITGICPLQNGSFLLADYHNKKLKRLDTSYVIKESIPIDGSPIGLCSVGKKEVAVCLHFVGKIQFVSVENSLKLTSTISVDTTCHGISYGETIDEMYACCGASIKVYNRAGTLLRAYDKGTNGEQLFYSTRQVTVNAVNSQIIVADDKKGLVALDIRGTNEWLLSDQELSSVWGLCILPNGIILASGNTSNNVLQVDKTGRKMGVLLGAMEGLKYPYSLAFGKRDSRLIVGCNSEEIFVYTLSRK
ncbi:uncharacterized protein LOC123546733 [Mercenaria mercenaria]|uniref:uncharacterized protein LOC123546733 n=1 Tax=Mercenaria mercenaria TaxID=6596 RepID=UPI00234EE15D|nr:uncharacterized protein LOC123546733 [Mercenaria mercenaria]